MHHRLPRLLGPLAPPKPTAKIKLALPSDSIALDPDGVLSDDIKGGFRALHREFDDVFDPHFRGYNGDAGPFQAKVNMGPI